MLTFLRKSCRSLKQFLSLAADENPLLSSSRMSSVTSNLNTRLLTPATMVEGSLDSRGCCFLFKRRQNKENDWTDWCNLRKHDLYYKPYSNTKQTFKVQFTFSNLATWSLMITWEEDHRSFKCNFTVAKRKPEKIQACTALEPLTSAIPVQRSNQLS